jgi:two-component system sensor histidine kinase QseC
MNSIRRRLTRELLGAALALVGGSLLALYFAARHTAIAEFDDALQVKAHAICTMTLPTPTGVNMLFSNRFMRGFDKRTPHEYFEIRDQGRQIARSGSLKQDTLPQNFGTLEAPQLWDLPLPNGEAGRAIGFTFRPRDPANDRIIQRELQIAVAVERAPLDATLRKLLWLAVGCAVTLAGAAIWYVPRVLDRGLQPLQILGEHAAQIDARSLATRFPTDHLPAELQPITGRLNDLLARLEASFERERRFSADLAHELRTPLAELRSLAECSVKWPDTRDHTTDRETLAIARQMEQMVAHMLALARGERGQLAIHPEPVAVDEVVQRVWRTCAERAAARDVRVRLTTDAARTEADPTLLGSIVANLCDNAVDYTPPGGAIDVGVESAEGRVVLRITNTTADLEAADVPRLFERFWRKENARTGGKHLGLGLSIARAFAEAMGWTLTATSDAPQRLTFTLTSPATA